MSKFTKTKKVYQSEFIDWLDKEIKLTDYQKQKIYNDEVFRWCPYDFYKEKKRITNFWIRLSILIYPLVYIGIFISLPFKFLFTGRWGYNSQKIQWFRNWANNLGL